MIQEVRCRQLEKRSCKGGGGPEGGGWVQKKISNERLRNNTKSRADLLEGGKTRTHLYGGKNSLLHQREAMVALNTKVGRQAPETD